MSNGREKIEGRCGVGERGATRRGRKHAAIFRKMAWRLTLQDVSILTLTGRRDRNTRYVREQYLEFCRQVSCGLVFEEEDRP